MEAEPSLKTPLRTTEGGVLSIQTFKEGWAMLIFAGTILPSISWLCTENQYQPSFWARKRNCFWVGRAVPTWA